MTYKELAEAILKLDPFEQGTRAVVWPPQGCPASEPVPITELKALKPTKTVAAGIVMLTGKNP